VIQRLRQLIEQIRIFFEEDLWRRASDPRSAAGRARRLAQLGSLVVEGFVRDRLLLRASALTYFMVLSLIPMIAVALSITKGLGLGQEATARLVAQVVDYVAAGSPGARDEILDLIQNASFGALGAVGGGLLFATTVLGISNVERALNAIWGVTNHRPWARRFTDYLAVLVVAPVLGIVALSAAATLQSQWVLQRLLDVPAFEFAYNVGLRYVPALVLAVVFSFLFKILPNTHVRISSAALGGLVAAVLVILAQQLYLGLQVGVGRANAMFGGFAALPLLFVWMYIFWAVVLLGAEIAFAHQNLESYREEVRGADPTPAQREAVALRVAVEVARAFRDAAPAPSAGDVATACGVSIRSVREALRALVAAELVVEGAAEDDEDPRFSLGRPAERIRVADVLVALRGQRERSGDSDAGVAVESLLDELAEAAAKGPAGRSLADVLHDLPPRS
jgi:membrane protein